MTVTLGDVVVHLLPGTRQVLTVEQTEGWHAQLTLWQYDGERWQAVLEAPGRTGSGGLVAGTDRVQGTSTTPLGSFPLLEAFGTHASPVTRLDYRQIGPGDFWVCDNESEFYNRWRHQDLGGFRWELPASDPDASERLTDYPVQYEYAVNIGFNRDQVRHRGAAIFLHVDGAAATGGCVSGPRDFLRELFERLDPAQVPLVSIGHGNRGE